MPLSKNLTQYEPAARALLDQMSLAEKIGQVSQVEKNSITPDDVAAFGIGSVLSGGGGNPDPNTPQDWATMVRGFQEGALRSRLGIPILYGTDAVHGHNNVNGAVLFPHNIGLGATRNPSLVEKIGEITAIEMMATGANWNFAPALSVPQDIRWGRTFEGYSQDTELVTELGNAFLRGLQRPNFGGASVLGCIKHFVGDGGTRWGTTTYPAWLEASNWQAATENFRIDQGDTQMDEDTLRRVHLAPYLPALESGALSVMVSFSSWNGLKLHAHHQLLTEILKGELGFEGFLISDWGAIDQIEEDYYQCVVKSINAGLDMIMLPFDYKRFIETLTHAVENGDVSEARIDDAVMRILKVKFAVGVFENPWGDADLLSEVGSEAHRDVAREAVKQSLVLLKNENDLLPLSLDTANILVAGIAANDIGLLCGGWSVEWQGASGKITQGKTILDGLRRVATQANITYNPSADVSLDQAFDVGIVVLAETPYAEGNGDQENLALSSDEIRLLQSTKASCRVMIVILSSGRPRLITEQLPLMDALVIAWLPGTEADIIAEVLFGHDAFTGQLPYIFPREKTDYRVTDAVNPLFDVGFGLQTTRHL